VAGRRPALSDVRARQPGQHLVEPDGKVPHPHPGGVEHRVGHGRTRPAHAQLAEALDAKHVGFVVKPVQQNGIERRDVGVHRHEVFGEIAVDEGARLLSAGWARQYSQGMDSSRVPCAGAF
jgi:hypothetical protein